MQRRTLGFLDLALRRLESEPVGKVWRLGTWSLAPEGPRGLSGISVGMSSVRTRPRVGSAKKPAQRLTGFAAELVRLPVDVIVVGGSNAARRDAASGAPIPHFLAAGGYPVGVGLVASLAQPGGNITGLCFLSSELAGKRLELLKEAVPTASRVAILFNPPARARPISGGRWRAQPGRWVCGCTAWRCARPISWNAPSPPPPVRARRAHRVAGSLQAPLQPWISTWRPSTARPAPEERSAEHGAAQLPLRLADLYGGRLCAQAPQAPNPRTSPWSSHQVRADHQPRGRQGHWPHHSPNYPLPGQRGHQVGVHRGRGDVVERSHNICLIALSMLRRSETTSAI